jgi:hypothetical protein
MKTRLDELLQTIDPSRTIDVVEQRINQALSGYYRGENTVETWDEYQRCLAEFLQEARNTVLTIPSTAGSDVEMNFQEAITLLRQEYPGNTPHIVYQIIHTGVEGGVYAVIRALARILAETYAQHEIDGRVMAFWDSLSGDEKVAAAEEYLEKYQSYLSPHLIPETGSRIKASFWRVLQDHPRMIKRLRDIR